MTNQKTETEFKVGDVVEYDPWYTGVSTKAVVGAVHHGEEDDDSEGMEYRIRTFRPLMRPDTVPEHLWEGRTADEEDLEAKVISQVNVSSSELSLCQGMDNKELCQSCENRLLCCYYCGGKQMDNFCDTKCKDKFVCDIQVMEVEAAGGAARFFQGTSPAPASIKNPAW